jgi:hypothetical protein
MPPTLLSTCRQYLAKLYRERLGKSLSDSLGDLSETQSPVWRYVKADDLTTKAGASESANAGLLLDPEIGLMCYLLPFVANTQLRRQISRALKLRSQLSSDRSESGEIADYDQFGAWRVAAVWLVDVTLKDTWIEQVTDVRRETAFSEEISLDAIFLTSKRINTDLETYGFPRLLLTTRQVLRTERQAEMTRWMSADTLVEKRLAGFAKTFSNPEQQELASEVSQALARLRAKPADESTELPETPVPLHSLRVQDFRNLRDVHLEFGFQPVSAHIIHGPNGTGKTSLCEAISIALFGSSQRYKAFANRDQERDVVGTNRAAAYVDEYLAPLDSPSVEPKISLNGGEPQRPRLVDPDGITEADLAMCGTVLMQDSSREFTRLSSHELGARVLRGYSNLADEIEEFTDSRYNQASAARQEFLRTLGLSAAITKLDTAFERISRSTVDKSLPGMPHRLVSWMESLSGTRLVAGALDLAPRWTAWGGDDSRSELYSELAQAASEEAREKLLRHWLQRYAELTTATNEFLSDITRKLKLTQSELERARGRVIAWGEWIDRRRSSPPPIASSEAEVLAGQKKDLETEAQRILNLGQQIKTHLDHLIYAETFIQQNWAQHHENECPTCGTDHKARGGIRAVVEELRSKVATERERLLQIFKESKAKVDATQKRLGHLGQSQCPLSPEEQNELAEQLQWLIPESRSVESCITDVDARQQLLRFIHVATEKPFPPANIDVDSEARRVGDLLRSQLLHARTVFEGPDNWKPVKEGLTRILATIVNEHLPNTLARLWCELTMTLTAAPWLLPGRPSIDVTTRRGEKKSTIEVQDRLARYILNQAEVHTLGLAWFFTRYLTHGRFSHSCIVLDDPAQELDQTSFRDLCRLWETWIRLHKIYHRPLRFLVMLNQESRALDAARATGGLLGVLGWSREQEESVKTLNLHGARFCPPQPMQLFEAAAS